MTVGHIYTLHFANLAPISGNRIVRRTLARLRDLRVLGALERRIGGIHAGSQGLVHYVDVVGDRLLRGTTGRTTRRPRVPSERFLQHRLAVADTHIALVEADRRNELDLVACAVEPASWRSYTGIGGSRLTVKPDLYVETAAEGDLVHAYFVEVDLGTEGLVTMLRKCRDYENYRQSGIEQSESGTFPLVLWSMTHWNAESAAYRRQALQQAIGRDHTLPSSLYRIVAPEHLVATLAEEGKP